MFRPHQGHFFFPNGHWPRDWFFNWIAGQSEASDLLLWTGSEYVQRQNFSAN